MAESTPDEPRWELLPDDPVGFFGLSRGFDGRALRLAYISLLRRYGPERAPRRFQALRAAYEELDARLRYSGAGAAAPRVWERLTPAEPPSSSPAGAQLAALLDARGPRGCLQALRELPARDGALWLRIALLEDALEPSDPLALARVLLEGLRDTRGDPRLQLALHLHVREPFALDAASRLLELLAESTAGPAGAPGLNPPGYWFLTEPLWLGLLPRVEFSAFARLLEACRARVGEAGSSGELVLAVALLRRARFRADAEWLARTSAWVHERCRQAPERALDLDLADWLGRYAGERAQLLAQPDPLRKALDEALVAVVVGEEPEAERAFLAAQVACAADPGRLLATFGPENDPAPSAVAILRWYAELRSAPERADPERARVHLEELLLRLERRTDRSPLGCLWSGLSCMLLPVVALLVFAGCCAVVSVAGGHWRDAAILAPSLPAIWFVFRGPGRRWWARLGSALSRRAYRRTWRAEVAVLMAATHLDLRGLVALLIQPAARKSWVRGHLLDRVASDPGLELYGLSLRDAA